MRTVPRLLSMLLTVGALTGTATLVSSCNEEPTVPAEPVVPGAVDRDPGPLRAAILFAGELSARALPQRDQANQVAYAFAEIAQRLEADDRSGTEQAIAAARKAIGQYRNLSRADASAAAAELAAMDLTLEHASLFSSGKYQR